MECERNTEQKMRGFEWLADYKEKTAWSDYTKKTRRYHFAMGLCYSLIVIIPLGMYYILPGEATHLNNKLLSIFAAVGVIVTGMVAETNRRYQKKQVQVTIMPQVFELLSSKEIREAREKVHQEYCRTKKELGVANFRTNPNNIRMPEYIDKVLSSFDQVSALVLNRLLDQELVFDAYGGMIVRDWNTLRNEIDMRRSKNKRIVRHFEELKDRFLKRIEKENKKIQENKKLSTKDKEEKETKIEPYCHDE